ncbi:uncharacterized protein LOC114535456 [Dendronephthya gigantea]|uniref:uncharacterized protein LOC114535456 n=1 Tax=Dendronephthya gigantea TaxID=151771 RepID=UPI00106D729D|nr:uncharacterized protein LOC114535456 [Dendronephthya gigantea]
MSNNITAEQLKTMLDEKLDQKLTPLNLKISELSFKLEDAMRFIELANSQYEEVMMKFKTHEEERIKLQEENKILKSALQFGKLMGVEIAQEDLSVSHRLPTNKRYKGNKSTPAIIVKFTRRDVKEAFFRSRNKLKNKTTCDLGYRISNLIYINESLTEKNKELFKHCLRTKKELNYKFIWTSNGRIYLRQNEGSSVIHIKNKDELTKLPS